MHDHVDSFGAVIDIHKTAGLLTVTPDFDLTAPGVLGLDDLATEGGRGFLPPAVPGAEWAVDVVETGDEGLQSALCPVFLTEYLRHQLLPAVAPFSHGRVGIAFLQGSNIWVLLKLGVVRAGGGGEEVAIDPRPIGSFDQMGIDQDAAQTLHTELLDEAHAAHVCG